MSRSLSDNSSAHRDHPLITAHALAQGCSGGAEELEMVVAHEGRVVRLFHRGLELVFKRMGDPGSALDRQRFDYQTHIRISEGTPEAMLDEIKIHIATAREARAKGEKETK